MPAWSFVRKGFYHDSVRLMRLSHAADPGGHAGRRPPHRSRPPLRRCNGTDFGIRVSALGDRWLTAPVNTAVGLYFSGFGPDDANPDMGDSAIVETIGLGGVAMAASPAVARFVGASGVTEAFAVTDEMREIIAKSLFPR